MQVAKDTLVTISAKMYNLQGDLMESADELVYLHGHSDIFPVIEKALEGKKPGETVRVQLEPEEAFGDYDETALIIRPETDFEEGVEVGLSYTEIARKYHIDPRTAKKYAESETRPVYNLSNPKPSKLDPYKEQIRLWLEEAPYSAERIFEKIKEQGCPISPWWLTLSMMRATTTLRKLCINRSECPEPCL